MRVPPDPEHMQILCERLAARLEYKLAAGLIAFSQTTRAADPRRASCGSLFMQDLFWIAITLGLLAATLAYVQLCDNA